MHCIRRRAACAMRRTACTAMHRRTHCTTRAVPPHCHAAHAPAHAHVVLPASSHAPLVCTVRCGGAAAGRSPLSRRRSRWRRRCGWRSGCWWRPPTAAARSTAPWASASSRHAAMHDATQVAQTHLLDDDETGPEQSLLLTRPVPHPRRTARASSPPEWRWRTRCRTAPRRPSARSRTRSWRRCGEGGFVRRMLFGSVVAPSLAPIISSPGCFRPCHASSPKRAIFCRVCDHGRAGGP